MADCRQTLSFFKSTHTHTHSFSDDQMALLAEKLPYLQSSTGEKLFLHGDLCVARQLLVNKRRNANATPLLAAHVCVYVPANLMIRLQVFQAKQIRLLWSCLPPAMQQHTRLLDATQALAGLDEATSGAIVQKLLPPPSAQFNGFFSFVYIVYLICFAAASLTLPQRVALVASRGIEFLVPPAAEFFYWEFEKCV